MININNTRFYIITFLITVLAVIGFAIWQSSQPSSSLVTVESLGAEVLPQKTGDLSNQSQASTPPAKKLPIPAQQLNKLLSDPGSIQINNSELEQKIQQLDQQLAEINAQLNEHGVDVPKSQVQSTPASDTTHAKTEQRLNAIKEHMSKP